MNKLFDSIQVRAPKLNKFDLSHERKLTMEMGFLIPTMVMDVIPGDKIRVKAEALIRMAPMLAPIMHRVDVTTHYFFVPNRLLWDEWEDFITGGADGESAPVFPKISLDATTTAYTAPGGLADHLGIPTVNVPNPAILVSALPARAYQLVYNEYYRDQNLIPDLEISKASGTVAGAEAEKLLTLRKRAWEKDYFTSALPFAQRGAPVSMPVDGTGSVTYKDASDIFFADGEVPAGTTALSQGDGVLRTPNGFARVENIDEVNVTGSNITINDLRKSIKLQEWLELSARAGARYVEQIRAFFGVRSSDARLQRPEYLGGMKNPMSISEVVSTFEDPTQGNPQGNMAGHGISVGRGNGFSRTFEEHGIIIGLISVLPKPAYQQGLPRFFTKFDKFDFFWPQFANIGEQEVKQKEIYLDENDPAPGETTFGYQSRYAEYKYQSSTVHGEFKTSLNFWHMGRIFATAPALNAAFVSADPTNRIFAVTGTEYTLYCQIYNKVDALRPMPYFGTPTL